MSRICIVGTGTPSFLPARRHAGPGMRTAHFARALARRSHELLVLSVHAGATAPPESRAAAGEEILAEVEGRQVAYHAVEERDLDGPDVRRLLERFAPEAIVGATAHASALASGLAPALPFWGDLFGDPMAEAQAKAAVHASDVSLVHFWAMLAPVLERADRLSAVSRAHADAVIGQLGLAGRLGAATAGEDLVSVIPCAAEASVPSRRFRLRGSVVPRDAFVVLWSGSFNTWCDVETLVAGLDRAMTADERVHFVATGGSVEGHDEVSFARFERCVAKSPHRARYSLLGWLDSDLLPDLYAGADVGVSIERALYERRLGSENRVVEWMAHGLSCVTTGVSELGRRLLACDLAFGCDVGDPDSLARALLALAGDRERCARAGRDCRAYAVAHTGYESTAESLLRWCASPTRAGDAGRPRPLAIGLVSEPRAMVHLLEDYLASLSLGQVGYRSLRWLTRRLAASFGSASAASRRSRG